MKMSFNLNNVFDQRIVRRGMNYYRESRVRHVIKDGDKLFGVVEGSFDYQVDVDMNAKTIDCNCPYEGNCKHAVAVVLAYEDNEFIDGSKLRSLLAGMSSEALVELVFENVLKDYRLAKKLLRQLKVKQTKDGKKSGKNQSKIYDGLFNGPDSYYFPRNFIETALEVSAENKETILAFLEKVVEHEDDIIQCFPEDYYPDYYAEDHPSEEELYGTLNDIIDSFFSQKPSEKELKGFHTLMKKDEYGLLKCTEAVLKYHQTVADKYAKILLDNSDYVDYLLKHGRIDDALRVCEDEVQKFNILQTVDKEKALRYGLKKLIPKHANLVAEFMLKLGKDRKEILDVVLKDADPSYELLCRLEDHVVEKKYLVYDILLKNDRYKTYYLLCKRFKDLKALRKLSEVELDDQLAVSVGKHLIGDYPQEGIKILEKTMLKFIAQAYGGYMHEVTEIMTEIHKTDKKHTEKIHAKIEKKYPTRTKLKHELRKICG